MLLFGIFGYIFCKTTRLGFVPFPMTTSKRIAVVFIKGSGGSLKASFIRPIGGIMMFVFDGIRSGKKTKEERNNGLLQTE